MTAVTEPVSDQERFLRHCKYQDAHLSCCPSSIHLFSLLCVSFITCCHRPYPQYIYASINPSLWGSSALYWIILHLNIYPWALLIGEQQLSATSPKLRTCDHNLSVSVLWVITTSNHLRALEYFLRGVRKVSTPFSPVPGFGRRFAEQFSKISFSEKCFQENPWSE